MGIVEVSIKIQIEEIIEIDTDDLMHQSIDAYMEDVVCNLEDYVDIHNSVEWEVE